MRLSTQTNLSLTWWILFNSALELGKSCLHIPWKVVTLHGWRITPNLSRELGPWSQEYLPSFWNQEPSDYVNNTGPPVLRVTQAVPLHPTAHRGVGCVCVHSAYVERIRTSHRPAQQGDTLPSRWTSMQPTPCGRGLEESYLGGHGPSNHSCPYSFDSVSNLLKAAAFPNISEFFVLCPFNAKDGNSKILLVYLIFQISGNRDKKIQLHVDCTFLAYGHCMAAFLKHLDLLVQIFFIFFTI